MTLAVEFFRESQKLVRPQLCVKNLKVDLARDLVARLPNVSQLLKGKSINVAILLFKHQYYINCAIVLFLT